MHKLAICSSASFYNQVVNLSREIEALGITVILPSAAQKMKDNGETNFETKTNWSNDPAGYHGKALLIREHFNHILGSDAILVANYAKHSKENYIGPNVLMEMRVAFSKELPIYILGDIPSDSLFIDELHGLEPICLRHNLTKLTT